MLRRQKLPRKFSLNQPGQVYSDDFIKPEHVVVRDEKLIFPLIDKLFKIYNKFTLQKKKKYGEILEIFGKKFKINGCDKFTQDYYRENFNRDFPLSSIEELKPKEQTSKSFIFFINLLRNFKNLYEDIVIPPYNGFGDEEDSLGYVYKLLPLPPKKNYFKWVDNQIYLRFSARFNTKKPEDVDR